MFLNSFPHLVSYITLPLQLYFPFVASQAAPASSEPKYAGLAGGDNARPVGDHLRQTTTAQSKMNGSAWLKKKKRLFHLRFFTYKDPALHLHLFDNTKATDCHMNLEGTIFNGSRGKLEIISPTKM